MNERTLILIKPDGVAHGHIGEIISRIERKGLKIIALDLRLASEDTAKQHYAEHADKPFFTELVDFITSGPLVAGVIEGPRAVSAWRQLAGGTDPVAKATPGTIRGDFALEVNSNVVHGSDSVESAAREIKIWFPHL
ncbi:nucleoside-diphosphate kinase [Corynebacterium sp. ES2794-CONJ1]|uniref:nucleoside-diphosphate kinase n=1 Tax=unclassified Corynebacterium TaxID=2624378 RepID=UPI002168F99B|nr:MULTISPECIES: nucleoside-diphosphate kinase [unclassified Corynebacterium]MCS4490700.1 nucleoside-diphosphate kinase [Corynebacterium sp. ES2775-CONJ]MCS4492502.1 nucleoside-diphosphate kinase [Corynebacterium sp. ES2715-CONJ3]MCS4532534.1 nucleoside-diphosphate kinase [Corynebacterium sp. ES2730-CONJ]MCU9519929.1 nucleoside-diphosphate kinase [Corynebacterium sp. ES2794-CONJ1]